MATLFDSCSAILYAGVYKGDSSTQGTLFSIIPNSGQADGIYTGSSSITSSTRIDSSLNFEKFTSNLTPKIDYSYSSESFSLVYGDDVTNRPVTSSISQGTSTGALILEGSISNYNSKGLQIGSNLNSNYVTSSLSKFPLLEDLNYNIITFQENNNPIGIKAISFNLNDLPDITLAKVSLCVSGGISYSNSDPDKARILRIDSLNYSFIDPPDSSSGLIVINPAEFSNAKQNSDSASLFIRTDFSTLEITDIGDNWLRLSYVGLISGSKAFDKLRIRIFPNNGNPDGALTPPTLAYAGSGSAPFSDNNPANFISDVPKFSIANLQVQLIEGDISSSLSGSTADLRSLRSFVPSNAFIPTKTSIVAKPSESLEIPLTSSTVSDILTNKNQGTIIARFGWTPVSGSNEVTSNHFSLLKTGSDSTTDFLRIDGRGIFYRDQTGTLKEFATQSSQVPYLLQSGSLFSENFNNYAFTWSGSAMSCSINSGSIISSSTDLWTGSAAEQLEYIGGVMGISPNTQVRLQYLMVSPHKFDGDALQNATNPSII